MHGGVSGYLLVNAEVDSMGGVIDSGGGIGIKTSPRRTAIEKAQAELRQEYDVREERRRELEFLEKGGNPLDFKFGIATSHSVQSTSLTDQQAEHFVNSEVKDSFALAASPHGDSVESSGRPGVPTISEPNTADNLLLFDSENKSAEGERNLRYPNRQNRTSESERSSKANTNQNTKETEDSAIFRPYARRNRSKINRDPARSSSTDVVQNRGGVATSISIRRGLVDGKGCIPEAANQRDRHTTSVSCPIFENSNGNIVPKNVAPTNPLNSKVDGGPVVRDNIAGSKTSLLKDEADITHRKSSAYLPFEETSLAGKKAQLVLTSTEIGSPKAATIAGQDNNSIQLNGLRDSTGEKENLADRGAAGTKGLESDSSHANNLEVDVGTEGDLYRVGKLDSDEIPMQKASSVEGLLNQTAGERTKTKIEDETGQSTTIISECSPGREMQMNSVKVEDQSYRSRAELQNEEKKLQDGLVVPENDRKVSSVLADNPSSSLNPGIPQVSVDESSCMVGDNVLSGTDVEASKHQPSSDACIKVLDTLREDSILEEARIIQAKRKRIAELSCGTAPVEVREKSQWDFVLEEMTWLANDFAQERIWKMTAAAQICHRVALTCQLKFEERIQHRKLKNIASILSNAILQFWSSVNVPEETSVGIDKETCQESNRENGRKYLAVGVREYASRFLKYNNSSIPYHSAAPSMPNYICDPEILDVSLVDQFTEESLFYSVPSGAMMVYQKSIETHIARCESGNSMQEEVDTSGYDAAGDIGYDVTAFDEDEGETSAYYLPGAFECTKSFNLSHKKRKNLMKSHSARSYDIGADVPYVNYTGGSNSSNLMKRPTSNINVGSVPTRRVRTASRQRIVSPFGCTTSGNLPAPSKTDGSSGDTSSFQDEQSTLHGGNFVQKGTEVESSGNFEKQLPYEMTETSGKPKKKKKTHMGSAYEQTWHLDSSIHTEQKDHWKKRAENHFDMNGLYGPHNAKKQKTTKQLVEHNFDSAIPLAGSIPSPAASQMSNMSNPNKSIKFIGGRDRSRKIKGLKISPGQHGSENPWSLFEDQALVVLVHDMGPNWELISDAMNSTLKIKCIYRNPSECKERHKILMDKTAGDGADSAEDSGNSQSYPSTLPGIPKGSARQLFQRLQGPMEEDTLKSHFEKICLIGKNLHYRKTQNDGRDPKQIVPVHNSQVMALSQVFPNNLNGGVLTPLDVCDASTSGQDVFSLENPGLPTLNQGTPGLPTSGANPSTLGSSGVGLGNNLPTTAGLHSPSVRDGRFNVPKGSLPLDEQHRLQQYNQMSSARNMQQPSLSSPGTGSGHRMVPGGNAMGVSGMNRSTPMSRPGFQGMGSPAMPNTGSMVGIPNSGTIHSGGGTPQGNSMLRPPREAVQHMMRMQAAQGNSQGIPAFSGLSSGFTNQTTPVQAYPGHQMSQQSHVLGNSHHPHLQSPSHATGAQQDAFALRQRQMQQRYVQQQQQLQQQQFPASGTMMPHGQQPQGTSVSSSPQNSPQTQPPVSTQPLPMPPVSTSPNMNAMAQQNPQKSLLPLHSLGRNPQSAASGVNNQAGKQRQRQLQQQSQQSGRQHPHQRQPMQGQQQNKQFKGMGRGIHQNITVDQSHLNGLAMAPGNQATEKGEAVVPVRPDQQQSNAGAATSTHLQAKPFVPPQASNHSQQLPKAFPGASSPSQQQQIQLPSDNSTQGQSSPAPPGNIVSTTTSSITPAVAPSSHQHLLLHQKQRNQVQSTAQRVVHHNYLGNSDLSRKFPAERMPRIAQPVSNPTHQTPIMSITKGVPQASNDSKNIKAVGSTAAPSSNALEPPSCAASVQTAAPKVVNSSNTDSAGSDPVTTPNQGLAQKPLPGGLPIQGPKGVIQRQQSLPSVEKRPKLPEQLTVQNQKHLASDQQPQLEEAQELSSPKPPDTKVE
ncbi:chromatin modification-related protein EAF1 B isoform X2 [Eutrema salsugineum]|uniref:chromatin modification-related protein EAF1 B isoform X2 n=1 Tax=Eutrema salsugineum TaxID=72664 RepID=UPI000CED52E7|nr:chromatin modification-related protein EAF1 B isoform X2 [Eutrema salsugineum]